MERVPINRCLNKELKYYGLKFTGLISALILGILVLMKFDFTFALIGAVAGYLLGSGISTYWYKGHIQRWAYWNLPTRLISGSKYLPKSCDRRFL